MVTYTKPRAQGEDETARFPFHHQTFCRNAVLSGPTILRPHLISLDVLVTAPSTNPPKSHLRISTFTRLLPCQAHPPK
uniref:Uncharacterized protein n=1 Tax=Aegilops tauschii subsp. strangulata TaxID=200361 RepID=A0A453KHM2_AEGTS